MIATLCAMALHLAGKTPAEDALTKPKAVAKASNRFVFAVFTASWCHSCSDLKALLEKPSFSKLFSKKFVTTYVDVSDSSKSRNLQLRTQYCSDKAPMPAYAIIDPNGKLIANSFGNSIDKRHQTVLSYPFSPATVGDFMRMVNKVPKGFDMDTLWKIRAELEKDIH